MDIEDHFAQSTVPILARPAGSTAIRVSVNKVGFQFGGTLSTVTKLPILGVAELLWLGTKTNVAEIAWHLTVPGLSIRTNYTDGFAKSTYDDGTHEPTRDLPDRFVFFIHAIARFDDHRDRTAGNR
jgi:hypothetical protein